ncbi:hypothetical protein [Occultella gossypii]|uniref:hypothetical protein n=1 Tax=Occultella gossypii TaxID=2800820 RepID=UPI001CBCE6DB|nr:hypothetical protein [Occultella gossypii]
MLEHLGLVEKVAEREVEQALIVRFRTRCSLGRGMAFIGRQIHLSGTGESGPAVRNALASTSAPVAVADYQGLPADAREVLPAAAELEAVIEDEMDHHA